MVTRIVLFASALALTAAGTLDGAQARARAGKDAAYGGGVPYLDVKGSCSDAQKFSTGMSDKDVAFKGCMQDEMNAKSELGKRWGQFKTKDKQDCVEQSRNPSPSYVEVLTCLEMNADAFRNAPVINGKPVPQIGGPVAPGLNDGAPGGTATPVPRT